jgi:hypothetical protein
MKEREQDIEHGYHRSLACLDVGPKPVMNTLEIENDCHHRQCDFDTNALVPGALGTQFAIVVDAIDTAKDRVSQHNALPIHVLDNGMKLQVIDNS